MAAPSISLSSPPLTAVSKPKPRHSLKTCKSSLNFTSSQILPTILHSEKVIFHQYPPHKNSPRTSQIWRISAMPEDVLPSETTPIVETQQLISTDDGGVSTIVSVLLIFAFVGLSTLTLGVIYIGVTDFLQKREREKFEKEEAAKKKKGGKKGKVRDRTGPRGFGQKIDEDDDY